jgi:PAS domain S-box-containing protein
MPTRYQGGEVWSPGPGRLTFEGGRPISAELSARWFQALYETPLLFSGILDREGRVLDANQVSIEGCGLVRQDIIGHPFWEGGWWSPDPRLADQIRRWCQQTLASGNTLRTTSQYFLGDGSIRMVDLALYPVSDGRGGDDGLDYIVATGLDITDALRARAQREELMADEAEKLRELAQSRRLELTVAQESERLVRDRLAKLAGAAMDMVAAETVADLTGIVFERAFPVLDAEGGALIVRESDELRVFLSERLGDDVRTKYETAPFDSPFPGRYVARTGERLVLANRAAGIAFFAGMAQVYEDTKRHAWVYVPLKLGDRLLGSLAVSWAEERDISDDELELIEAFAAQCAQALERIQVTYANRVKTQQVQSMVESMQRSLLTRSPIPESLDIAVRYLPAAQAVHVGGDWYDAFVTGSGSSLVVVGDVAGHDADAAATMAQLRNLLRGLAINGEAGPASLLSLLDQAIVGLGLDAMATALVAQIDDCTSANDTATSTVRWSSAGHPPPLLRTVDGSVQILSRKNDLLLGVNPDVRRVDHTVELPASATMLFYTDGLVERRGENMDVGLQRLARVFESVVPGQFDQACDEIIGAMLPDSPIDDVVVCLLGVRGSSGGASPVAS